MLCDILEGDVYLCLVVSQIVLNLALRRSPHDIARSMQAKKTGEEKQ
ncbi:hypothetical protein SETIT_6G013800v2 [Setaria italica]|uniref:Uncharacterized protein n=1 Tax=Setaria italica TaxID=4555 RepID=A0A368RIM7_SETIT|nr:hypothetical protein SETIT_6G013800v2 [Setaria italica]